jgi:hypothetical protein
MSERIQTNGEPRAYWSVAHRCWFVPVSPELFDSPDKTVAEPCRVEIKDGVMWITSLETVA